MNVDVCALLSSSLDNEHLSYHFTDMFTLQFVYRQVKKNSFEQLIHLDILNSHFYLCLVASRLSLVAEAVNSKMTD